MVSGNPHTKNKINLFSHLTTMHQLWAYSDAQTQLIAHAAPLPRRLKTTRNAAPLIRFTI